MLLRFDDLTLFNVAFEVRFDQAFLVWDRSGAIWNDVNKAVPDLKAKHVEPNKVVFGTQGKSELDLSVELSRLGIIASNPEKTLREFSETAAKFTRIVVTTLEIERYSRVGLRLMFRKIYSKPEEAASALLSTGILKAAPDQLFGVQAATVSPEYSIRKEDGKNGFSIRFRAETVKLDLVPDFGTSDFIEPASKTENRVNYDVDCYTQAFSPVGSLIVSDWILQTYHVVKRDSSGLISGGL